MSLSETTLEGQLTTRAAGRVAALAATANRTTPGEVGRILDIELIPPNDRVAAVALALESGAPAVVVSWRRQNGPAETARQEVEGWLGGTRVLPGLTDVQATELLPDKAVAAAGFKHSAVLEHGSLRWWQLAHLVDVLGHIASGAFPKLAAAKTAVLEQAVVLGRHGSPTYRTVVVSRQPLDQAAFDALNPYVADADERIVGVAPAIVDALQSMYLMGYVLRRDLDALRAERSRLEQMVAHA
jgi:hypothetical protein